MNHVSVTYVVYNSSQCITQEFRFKFLILNVFIFMKTNLIILLFLLLGKVCLFILYCLINRTNYNYT